MSKRNDYGLGRTRLGKWYWSRTDRELSVFLGVLGAGVIFTTALVLWLGFGTHPLTAVTLGFLAMSAVNLGLAFYNITRI